ncbi:hypothetical protein [Riemerella anatipestifer]|uniref:hypothetical protein n=1 Tax=Riemerella anatipestifer TaxID=34085 RepID=UPI00129D31FC|nr:hypothetical protein [Riemerella anatipestifer]
MAKLKYTILLFLVVLLSPSISAQNNGGGSPPPTPPGSGGGVGFDVGAPPKNPIDLYSTEFILLAIVLILVTSYYLRKRQLKSL